MLLTLNNVSKSYGVNQVLNQASFILSPGQKIGLVGANGVGKSTLLKIVVGELESDEGTVALAPHLSIGYLPQVLANAEEQTVAEMINSALGNISALEEIGKRLRRSFSDTGFSLGMIC